MNSNHVHRISVIVPNVKNKLIQITSPHERIKLRELRKSRRAYGSSEEIFYIRDCPD